GRHPIVERLLKGESFVPNDTLIDQDSNIMLITGPNMAGKSVYMKQVALIAVLAHIGSFVPAAKAEISIVDKLFTRVGASDDQSSGRSTFMMEMSEVAYILDNMTDSSLILLDEIGRGTATYDGLSIAWSIIEFISQEVKAKTLFSTHYHELTELEGIVRGVKNYKLTLKEINGSIVFLRKLMRGSANRSFGIEVAGLAGLPSFVLDRAKKLLKSLEKADILNSDKKVAVNQLSLFNNLNNNAEINAILSELDIDNISPRHALDVLADLKEKAVKSNG
ncbi:MAG: DNA mismatch repair protein MutS, partial [Clostridia bacterium]|nr:DNA mismatch repair protein MutS [Clostridia bacterium]